MERLTCVVIAPSSSAVGRRSDLNGRGRGIAADPREVGKGLIRIVDIQAHRPGHAIEGRERSSREQIRCIAIVVTHGCDEAGSDGRGNEAGDRVLLDAVRQTLKRNIVHIVPLQQIVATVDGEPVPYGQWLLRECRVGG